MSDGGWRARRRVESSGERRDNLDVTSCANCGATLPADARFCSGCAAPVERRPVQPERAPRRGRNPRR
ncbi:MAG: zinc ribbon domain-containing protein [Actinobacteria bacterium]|nr:MAG: zinc ribbon domain-containing protein [Actinomycetota bacterium]